MVPRPQLNAAAPGLPCNATPFAHQTPFRRFTRWRSHPWSNLPACSREPTSTSCAAVAPLADDRWLSAELERGLTMRARRRELLQVAADSGSCVMVVRRANRTDNSTEPTGTVAKSQPQPADDARSENSAAPTTSSWQRSHSGAKRQRTASNTSTSSAQYVRKGREHHATGHAHTTTPSNKPQLVQHPAQFTAAPNGSHQQNSSHTPPTAATLHRVAVASNGLLQDCTPHQHSHSHGHSRQVDYPPTSKTHNPAATPYRPSRNLRHGEDDLRESSSRRSNSARGTSAVKAQVICAPPMTRSGVAIPGEDLYPTEQVCVSALAPCWAEAGSTDAFDAVLVGATVGTTASTAESYVRDTSSRAAGARQYQAAVAADTCTVSSRHHEQSADSAPILRGVYEHHPTGDRRWVSERQYQSLLRPNGNRAENGHKVQHGDDTIVSPGMHAEDLGDAHTSGPGRGTEAEHTREATTAGFPTQNTFDERTSSGQECSSSTPEPPGYPRVVRVSRNTRAGSLGGCVAKLIRSEGAADVVVMGRPALKVAMYGLAIARSMLQTDGSGRDCSVHSSWLQVRGNQLSKRRIVLHVTASHADAGPSTTMSEDPPSNRVVSEPFGPNNSASANRLAKSMVKMVLRRQSVTYQAWSYDGLYKVLVALAAANSIVHLHSQRRYTLPAFPQLQNRTCGEEERSYFHLVVQLTEVPTGQQDGVPVASDYKEASTLARPGGPAEVSTDVGRFPAPASGNLGTTQLPIVAHSSRDHLDWRPLLRQSSMLSMGGKGLDLYGGDEHSLDVNSDRLRRDVDDWDGGEVAERWEREHMYYEGFEHSPDNAGEQEGSGHPLWAAVGTRGVGTPPATIVVEQPAASKLAASHDWDAVVGAKHKGCVAVERERGQAQHLPYGIDVDGSDVGHEQHALSSATTQTGVTVVSHPLDWNGADFDGIQGAGAGTSVNSTHQVAFTCEHTTGADDMLGHDFLVDQQVGGYSNDTKLVAASHSSSATMLLNVPALPESALHTPSGGARSHQLGPRQPSKVVSADFFSFDPRLESGMKAKHLVAECEDAKQPGRRRKPRAKR